MTIYLLFTAVFCFGYYFLIVYKTKRWNSTFGLFWPIAGVVHVVMFFLPYRKAELALLAVWWGAFFFIEAEIWSAMKQPVPGDVEWVIVLGAQVRGTKITNSLKRRLDAALIYLKQHQHVNVIVSGGQGPGEDITEAEAMFTYLKKHGIEASRVYLEDLSTNTWENLSNSRKIMGDLNQSVAIVTNDFHLYRALCLARRIGFSNLQGIAASSNRILQLNYLVREFFGVLAMIKTGLTNRM